MNSQPHIKKTNDSPDLISERISENARRHPRRGAISDLNNVYSWKKVEDISNKVANKLLAYGLQRGDCVAIMAENSAEYICIIIGIMKAGMVVTPLSEFLDHQSLSAIMSDCKPKAFFASRSTRETVSHLLQSKKIHSPEVWVSIDFHKNGWCAFDAFYSQEAETPPIIDVQPEDAATLVYSSGTTGLPKGIGHTYGVRSMLGVNFSAVCGFTEKTKTLLATPLCSNWTLTGLLPTLWAGGLTIIMPRYNTEKFLELCESEKPDFTFLVPQQYYRILDNPKFNTVRLYDNLAKFCAGAPMSVNRKQEIIDRWPGEFIEIYGLTESFVTTSLTLKETPEKIASVGAPSGDVWVKIIDEDGNELPAGKAGEIVGHSPYAMTGYHNRTNTTKSLQWIDADTTVYMKTGDVGYLDEDGFLYIIDRKKDMIISGGLNIYPSDIEATLNTHPSIIESAVIPYPNERWGETPFAFVTVKNNSNIDASDLLSWVNKRLAKHQRLCGLQALDSFPRGSLDKILKKELSPLIRKENIKLA